MRLTTRLLFSLILIFICSSLFAQQTGQINGKVTSDNQPLPGVTVEARSNALPQARVTTTDINGTYQLPQLIPGSYTVTFTLAGMQTVTRRAEVLLSQTTNADVNMGVAGVSESITVTAESTLVDKTSTSLQSGLSQQQIQALPLTQNYSDLQKLVPGVQYTQDTVRGPSAGASGQENIYLFDGANITMPLFGVLVVQPNTNDIAQVNVTRGGANAIDFDRAGGFQIDTVSKSGTNKFLGTLGYQGLNHSFVANQTGTQNLLYQNDQSWATANIGGPILQDHLFFYGSYYRPYATRANASNVYGSLPQYKDTRNEEFGKLTFTPSESWLFNGSWRHSQENQTTSAFGSKTAGTAGTGFTSRLDLGNLEGSKIISPKSYFTFKLVDFRNPGGGRADNIVSGANVSTALGTHLDLNNLATIGQLTVPTPITGNAAQNAFIQPFIDKYGFLCPSNGSIVCTSGSHVGAGVVGFGAFSADNDSFFRTGGQLGYNYSLGSKWTHDLHVGYQRYNDSEDRFQSSNGWGSLSIPAGVGSAGTCPAAACGTATPAFFVAAFSQQTTGAIPVIHSEFKSQNIEFNDVIRFHNWAFNVGVLDSDDVLYGQGLAKADNVAGFVKSPGTKYKMHEWTWSQEIQPRLGATWSYNGRDTVFASGARYNPPANSDARAASWDRNLVAQINAYFDANGNLIGVQPNASSSGKWWQAGIKPPEYKEMILGTARQITSG
ncbi:MAG TPA: carboxypeptidase regulatory-like domain-containing protein, partial [Thermoanaerobaculia bacterium]